MDHPYYLEELLNYCKPDLNYDLKLVCAFVGLTINYQRGVRLISSICHSSKILRDLIKKKGGVYILNELVISKNSKEELVLFNLTNV